MKRLKNKQGETIAETLVAIMIMAIAFVIMTGAVAAAARINERLKNDKEAFQVSEDAGTEQAFGISVYQKHSITTDTGKPVSAGDVTANRYLRKVNIDEDSFYYYYYYG